LIQFSSNSAPIQFQFSSNSAPKFWTPYLRSKSAPNQLQKDLSDTVYIFITNSALIHIRISSNSVSKWFR